jgi:hypothetical protein
LRSTVAQKSPRSSGRISFDEAHHDGTFHRVLKLTHIARPVVVLRHGFRFARNAVDAAGCVRRLNRNEVPEQNRDILPAPAQVRSPDGHDVEAVIEVEPKAVTQILVRRRDDPHNRCQGPPAAQSLEFPFLENTQQLGVRAWRQFAHLVQKKRAADRAFKPGRDTTAPVEAPFS